MNFSTNELVVKKSLLLIALFLDALHTSKKYAHVIFRLHKVLWMWKSKIVAISWWLKVRIVTLHGHRRAYMSGQVPRPTNVGSLQLFNNCKSEFSYFHAFLPEVETTNTGTVYHIQEDGSKVCIEVHPIVHHSSPFRPCEPAR